MNRTQAEHVLDAYYDMRSQCGEEDACAGALREVIIDAMTSYQVQTVPSITWPNTKSPSIPTYKPPIVTW